MSTNLGNLTASGGHAAVEHIDDMVYLAVSLRNVGSGIAVCQGWAVRPDLPLDNPSHVPLEQFRLQSRDLYVPADDIGMWQGALRNPDDRVRAKVGEAIISGQPITIELLYSDQVGLQRTISRVRPDAGERLVAGEPESALVFGLGGATPGKPHAMATEAIRRDQQAAAERRAVVEDGPAVDLSAPTHRDRVRTRASAFSGAADV